MKAFTTRIKLTMGLIVLITTLLVTPCIAGSSCWNDTTDPLGDPGKVNVVYDMSKIKNATHMGTVVSTLWPGFANTGFGDMLAVERLKAQSAAKGADLLVIERFTSTKGATPLVGEIYKLNAE